MSHDDYLGIKHPIRPEPGAHNQRDDVDGSAILLIGLCMVLVVIVTVLFVSAYFHHYRHVLEAKRMATVGNWAAAVKKEQIAQIEPHYTNAAHTMANIGIHLAMDEVVQHYQAAMHPAAKPAKATSAAASAAPARPKIPLSAMGKKIYVSMGCIACHTVNGTALVGPTWKNLAGYPVKLTTGKTVTADYQYLRTMILYPGKLVVAGYPNIMPNYYGKLGGKKNIYRLYAIIWYINKLSNRSTAKTQPPVPDASGKGS